MNPKEFIDGYQLLNSYLGEQFGSRQSLESTICDLEARGWSCVITTAPGGVAFNAAHASLPHVRAISTSIDNAANTARRDCERLEREAQADA